MRAQCKVNGSQVKRLAWTSDKLRRSEGASMRVCDSRISAVEVQKLMFSRPILTEEETSDTVPLTRLGTIEICFKRCIKGSQMTETKVIDKGKRSAIEISETSKKGALLTSVTAFAEPEVRKRSHGAHVQEYHSDDKEQDYFSLRLRYAPRDNFQALGNIPLDIRIDPGDVGFGRDHPIAIEDDALSPELVAAARPGTIDGNIVKVESQAAAVPMAGGRPSAASSSSVRVKLEAPPDSATSGATHNRRESRVRSVKVKTETDREAADAIARRIAETRAELEVLEAQHRTTMAAKAPHPRSDDEEDIKENTHRWMGKRLKMAKERDNGFVGLTFEDE